MQGSVLAARVQEVNLNSGFGRYPAYGSRPYKTTTYFNDMSDKLLYHFLEKESSGLVHKPDARDHELDQEILGASPLEIKPLGRLEKLLESDLVKSENIIYQGGILSCVPSTSAFLNMWNSLVYDGNLHCESWAYAYKLAKHFQSGTSMNNVLDIFKKKGCCLESTLPSRPLADAGEAQAQDKSVLTEAMDEEAKNFQIEGYLSLNDLRREALYRVLMETPISVAANVGNTWSSKAGIVPPDPNSSTFGHNFALFDIVGESNISTLNDLGIYLDKKHHGWWIIINWWEKDRVDVRVLSPQYHFFVAKILKDKRDTKFLTKAPASKDMLFKLIKAKNDPKVFLLNLDNKKCWVKPEMSFEQLFGKDAWKLVEELEPEVVASYPVGPVIDTRDRGLLQAIKTMLTGLGAKK